MSLTKKTVGGFLWLGGVKASNAIFQFAILAILARLLTPTEFGLMGLALIVTSFAEIFNDMGFGPAITQKEVLNKTDIHTGFAYSLIFGTLLLIILQVSAPIIASFFKNDELISILRVVSFVLLLRSVITVPLGLMYRRMEFKKLSLIQIFSYVFGYGAVGISFALMGYGVWALVIGILSQTIISLILYLFYNKEDFGLSLNPTSFKELIHFGGGYSLSKVFSYIANKGDKVLVGRILGVEALGLYERGFQVVKYSSSLLGEIIDKVLFSPIAQKQNDRQLVSNVYIEITYVLSLIFFPLNIFIYCNAASIVEILLGPQWTDAVRIVQIMSFTVFFIISTRVGSTIVKSLGDVYRRAWRTLFYAIYIFISVYFGSRWGVEGAAWAVTIGSLINYSLAFLQVHSLTKVKLLTFVRHHLFGVLLFFIYYILYLFLNRIFIEKIESPILKLMFGGGVLIITLAMAFVFDKKQIFKNYYKKFKK